MARKDRDGQVYTDVRVRVDGRFQNPRYEEEASKYWDMRIDQHINGSQNGGMVPSYWTPVQREETGETFVETAFGLWIFKPWIKQNLGGDLRVQPKKSKTSFKSWFSRGRKG